MMFFVANSCFLSEFWSAHTYFHYKYPQVILGTSFKILLHFENAMRSMRYVNSLNYQLIDSHLKPHAVRSLGDLLLWPVFLSVPSRTLQMRVREDSPVSPVESSVLALPCTNGGTALVHPDGWAIHITPVMGEGPMFLLFFTSLQVTEFIHPLKRVQARVICCAPAPSLAKQPFSTLWFLLQELFQIPGLLNGVSHASYCEETIVVPLCAPG